MKVSIFKIILTKYKYQLALLLLCCIGYFEISFFIFIPKWDNINAFLPYRHIVGTWISAGHLPLWNPYQLLGYPMHSDPQSGAWYPITWLLSFINDYGFYSINIELCLHYFIGGLGMFLLGKRLKLEKNVAFIMGLAYMFSGFMVGTSQILVMIIAASWLPLSINYLLKALKEPSFENIFILALIQFFSLTGSYPAMTIILIYFFFVIALYHLYKSFKGSYSFVSLLRVFGGVLVLLLVMSGSYILSILEALPFMTRANAIPYTDTFFGNVAFTAQSFLSFILPYSVTANTEFFNTDASMSNGYMGLFLFIFMLAGLILTKDKWIRLSFLIGCFFLLIAIGMQSPVHYFFYKLIPGFNLFRHPAIFRVYALFFFIISAGYSLQFFIGKGQKGVEIKKALKVSLIFFALLIVIGILKTNYTLVDDYLLALLKLQENSPFNLAGHILIQGIIQFLLILAAFYFVSKGKLTARHWVLLVFIDLFLATQLNAPKTLYYKVPFQEFSAYYNSMPKAISNQGVDLFMNEINNDAVLPKQRALYNNLNSYAKKTAYDGYNPFKFQGLIDLRKSGLMKQVLNNPLFYLASELNELTTTYPIDSLSGIAYAPLDLIQRYSRNLAEGELLDLEVEYNAFTLDYNLSKGGLLFLNQNYNANWSAYINDKSLPIYQANVCLMAIDVPAGIQTLHLVYNSQKIVYAFYLSIISIFSGLLFIFIGRIRTIPQRIETPN